MRPWANRDGYGAVFRTQRFMAEVARRLAAASLCRLHVGSETVFGPDDETWNAGGDDTYAARKDVDQGLELKPESRKLSSVQQLIRDSRNPRVVIDDRADID